jgi:pimeloyl-ACP methyl ester carboxylesterase
LANSAGISSVFADQPPARAPIPRLVQILEIVDPLLYLQPAPMVNGENIRIDGGAHAGTEAYRKDVPGAEVHVLDAGHFALDEQPDEVIHLTEAFMQKLRAQ